MKTLEIRCAPVVFALVLFGCAQAPPPAPPDTRAADEQAIRDSETAWVKEFAAKDTDKIVAHYADDGTMLLSNTPTMTGKEAIRTGIKDAVADRKSTCLNSSHMSISYAVFCLKKKKKKKK